MCIELGLAILKLRVRWFSVHGEFVFAQVIVVYGNVSRKN